MSREIMQQALEFCQYAWRDISMTQYAFDELEKTIAALKAELAKPEQPDLRKAAEMALESLEELDGLDTETECVTIYVTDEIEALRQALAQPEHPLDKKADNARELGLDYEPEQEPIAWQVMVENEPMKEFSIKDMAHDWAVTEKLNGSKYSYWIRPLYAALPNREWVGLTDDEIDDIASDIANGVAAKLREKNS